MDAPFDLGVRDDLGNLRLAVEVKKVQGMTRQRATEMFGWFASRYPSFAHTAFLVATPERGYLWRGASLEPVEIDLSEELAPHFARIGIRPDQIHGYAFEALVAAWLERGLVAGTLPPQIRSLMPRDGVPWVTFESAA